jgi:hypothetical protein
MQTVNAIKKEAENKDNLKILNEEGWTLIN